MVIAIRSLQKNDLAPDSGFWETLNNLSVSDESGLLPLAEKELAWENINQQNSHIFVAVDSENGQIVGTIKLLVEQKFHRHLAKAGHIEDVVTRQGYERRGIAGLLIKAAIDKAREELCYKIILDCHDNLKDFYGRHGFAQSDICMRLDL